MNLSTNFNKIILASSDNIYIPSTFSCVLDQYNISNADAMVWPMRLLMLSSGTIGDATSLLYSKRTEKNSSVISLQLKTLLNHI